MFSGKQRGWLLILLMAVLPLAARGDGVPRVIVATPGSGGENSGAITRFTLRFSEAMIPLGDPRARVPATSDAPAREPANGWTRTPMS